MGRPPLNNRSTHVRLPPEHFERIEELVGSRGMSAFIREAVENELERREAEAALDEVVEDDGPAPGM